MMLPSAAADWLYHCRPIVEGPQPYMSPSDVKNTVVGPWLESPRLWGEASNLFKHTVGDAMLESTDDEHDHWKP